MKATEETVSVKHKENGIERAFTRTQNELMGKRNRKMFKLATPEEAGKDLNQATEKVEAQTLADENADLKRQLAEALAGKTQLPAEEVTTRTEQQLQNEGLRVENASLKAAITSATSSLETEQPVVTEGEGESDEAPDGDEHEADPNPELTALRASYEQATGKKPGRLGIDKMNEAIAAAAKSGVQPK
jgi:hypothetical protein